LVNKNPKVKIPGIERMILASLGIQCPQTKEQVLTR
jgi:hypothetical protein